MTSFNSSARAPAVPPLRGEVWLANLDPVRGHEQAGRRPVLVLSEDSFGLARRGLVIAVPFSTHLFPVPFHVRVAPPEGGLDRVSDILPEQIRSLSTQRLTRRLGRITESTMRDVSDQLTALLDLGDEDETS